MSGVWSCSRFGTCPKLGDLPSIAEQPARAATVEWLLDGDVAIRWQTLQDLLGAPAEAVATERANVANTGWGHRLLAAQGPDGRCLYGPKWTSTTYTLLLLRRLGLSQDNPQARRGVAQLWDHARYLRRRPDRRGHDRSARSMHHVDVHHGRNTLQAFRVLGWTNRRSSGLAPQTAAYD